MNVLENVMNRYLITTADERSWIFDGPVIFLGQWCQDYDRRFVWSSMDFELAKPFGLKPNQKEHSLVTFENLSNQLLKELSNGLNAFHCTDHSVRYWQIVLGHWLRRYVKLIFNRYYTLEQTLNNYSISGTTILDVGSYSLATADSTRFMRACDNDVWNHVLSSRILMYLSNENNKIESKSFQHKSIVIEDRYFDIVTSPEDKKLIFNLRNKLLPMFSRNNDAFIISSYLPRREKIKLELMLGQCPQIWRSPPLNTVLPDYGQRQRFSLDVTNYQGFDRFVRLQLADVIPSCYLEGYKLMLEQVKSLPWPAKPRFIYTSNNYDTDEIFKAWTGLKVEHGTRYYVGQHGNNGTWPSFENQPEVVTSDKYITWGWSNIDPKIVPAFIFKMAGVKIRSSLKVGGILLIETNLGGRNALWDNYSEFSNYQNQQFRFVESLPKAIQNTLTVRLHAAYKKYHWGEEERWQERCPDVRIESGRVPIQKLIDQNMLTIYSYDSTGILESLALNIPTMCFWHKGMDDFLPSAKPYYKLLRNAGILHDSPEQAAAMVTRHCRNVGEWWESPKVQTAREQFCAQYARIEKKPVRTLKHLLTLHESNQI